VYTLAMLTAITRGVSPGIVNCELTFMARQPIDLPKACEQHREYERLLKELGARVISLPAEPTLPDSMFVEDPALVLDELAVILPLGTPTRRPEAASLAQALSPFRRLEFVKSPGALEGGDVLRIGRRLFVGVSRRTNQEGIRQLTAIVAPYGYEVIAVRVSGCLHLKSAVTYLGRNTLLANRAWFDARPFSGYEWVDVAAEEPQVDDRARPQDAERVRVENSARHEVQLERAVLVDDRVPGVVAALESDDHVRLLRQEVSDLPFALVAPLSTDDGRHRHVFECYPGRWPTTRAPSLASSTRVRLRDGSLVHQSVASQSGSSAG